MKLDFAVKPLAFGRRSATNCALFRLCFAFAIAALTALAYVAAAAQLSPDRVSRPLQTAIEAATDDSPAAIGSFYRTRDFDPLWSTGSGGLFFRPGAMLKPEAIAVAGRMARALPEQKSRIGAAMSAARSGDVDAVARAELLLSTLIEPYRRRLHQPVAPLRLAFVDPVFGIPSGTTPTAEPDALQTLRTAASAPSLRLYLERLEQINPVYRGLSVGLERYRARWSRLPQVKIAHGPTLDLGSSGPRVRALRVRLGVPSTSLNGFDAALSTAVTQFQTAHGLPATGAVDAHSVEALNRGAIAYERLILANMERARLLPSWIDDRFVLVNVPAARLWMMDQGHTRESMRVVVGTQQDPTPEMAGAIRFAVVNPYWNLPVDIVRSRLAPQILRRGPGYLDRHNMEALSDWGRTAHRLNPAYIDWAAVARGEIDLRVRQRPGGTNQMGRVKFMLPNELGIYLHDTPDKTLFRRDDRRASAGCIRVENAAALSAWLLGSDRLDMTDADHRIDLPRTTPVFIVYLTAMPTSQGITFFPDIYGRDLGLLDRLRMV